MEHLKLYHYFTTFPFFKGGKAGVSAPTELSGAGPSEVEVTRDYQRLPEVTQNEILRLAGCRAKRGPLRPGNTGRWRDKIQMSKNSHAYRP